MTVARGRDSGRRAAISSLDNAVDGRRGALLGRPGAVGILIGDGATVEEAQACLDLAAGPLSGATVARLGIPGDPLVPLRRLPGAQLGDLDGADLIASWAATRPTSSPWWSYVCARPRARGARVLTRRAPAGTHWRPSPTRRPTEPGALMAGFAHIAAAIAEATAPDHPVGRGRSGRRGGRPRGAGTSDRGEPCRPSARAGRTRSTARDCARSGIPADGRPRARSSPASCAPPDRAR